MGGSKVLAQAGTSIADIYDVEGSIAGVERVATEEVQAVHEMGSTIFSERFGTEIIRISTGALAQNLTWDILQTDLPQTPARVLGLQVLVDVASRVNIASVAVRDPVAPEREIPIWSFDSTTDISIDIRIQENGAAVGNIRMLVPTERWQTNIPTMVGGRDQARSTPDIAFRGLTLGFGAGTVTTTVLLHLGFAELGGVSSHGLPIPSW